MEDEDFSSDTSDDDYVPTGVESDVEEASDAEEDDQGGDSDPEDEEGTRVKPAKKKALSKKKGKKGKKLTKPVAEETESKTGNDQNNGLNEQEKKEQVDSLWASFKKDVDVVAKQTKTITKSEEPETKTETVVKEFEFAGEKVKVTEEIKVAASSSSGSSVAVKRPPPVPTGRRGGLSNLSGLLGSKKQKLSTLEKSKLDWDNFKKEEGIEEEVKTFNQGKHGFLEKQDFLQRADLKQFEIERNLRQGRKTNR